MKFTPREGLEFCTLVKLLIYTKRHKPTDYSGSLSINLPCWPRVMNENRRGLRHQFQTQRERFTSQVSEATVSGGSSSSMRLGSIVAPLGNFVATACSHCSPNWVASPTGLLQAPMPCSTRSRQCLRGQLHEQKAAKDRDHVDLRMTFVSCHIE